MSEKKAESKAFGNVFSGAMSLFSTVAESAKAAKLDGGAEEIPYEDLMHLCMKMNKRMQMLEAKAAESVKANKTLQEERSALLDMFQLAIKVPPALANENINISRIKEQWMEYLHQQRQQTEKYEATLRRLSQQSPTTNAEIGAETSGTQSEALRIELEVNAVYMVGLFMSRKCNTSTTPLQQNSTNTDEALRNTSQHCSRSFLRDKKRLMNSSSKWKV